ncbi:hypothetical protein RJ639_044088 [Escallonia herrerae]|uniref:AB hydrolase-1 domain-containing protein n=1 Tax=Escallonia herrerae TaxID=1293975 RepID=A0AA88WCM7_9ASTE|nr:hypothetical protein RJ639_044088 [Escallonia herrerae]
MEQLVNFIIRPPRAEYSAKNDLLDQEFMLKGKWFQRKDLELVNSRGDVLQCSHYMPIVRPEGKALPCVIYCHGNSGCRADASEAAIILLPSNITVFTLDFSGSGISGGEHVTLGWNEKDDLRTVVNYLRADGNVSLIGLWGRSMGAVTSLMYGAEDPSIAGMVLDSPFSDLVDLMMELVDTYRIRLPKFTVKFAIQYMRRAILKKAKFDIVELNTIKVGFSNLCLSCKMSFVPVLLGHATDDDFIQPHHSDRIFDAYVVKITEGDKNIIKFEGDHNSPRPQFYFDSINIFFHNVLQPPEDEVGGTFFDMSPDFLGKGGGWSTVHEMGYVEDFSATPPGMKEYSASKFGVLGPAASSTVDAINELRSRRPMSRTEVPSDISSEDPLSEAQVEEKGAEPVPSSSKMINFEFSNGHRYGPQVPMSFDDDEYVEYPLDNLAGVPSNVEEEERMFMEAVIESLKDQETRHHHVEEMKSTIDEGPPGPSQKDDPDDSFTRERTYGSKLTAPDTSLSSTELPLNGAPSMKESGSTGAASCTDTSKGVQSASNTDGVDCTKATVTVVRNPTSNIMDGLLRRWDLNFFKNR